MGGVGDTRDNMEGGIGEESSAGINLEMTLRDDVQSHAGKKSEKDNFLDSLKNNIGVLKCLNIQNHSKMLNI